MKLRARKCPGCGNPFRPALPKQIACSIPCAIEVGKDARAKQERISDRARLAEMKPLRRLMAEAQAACNAYIRERDDQLPCVSCGRFHEGQWHAGHYMSTTARPSLRFDEANLHRQCQPCNAHLSGNLVAYRLTLIERIGAAEVQRLEAPAAPKEWTREELIALRAKFTAMRRELAKQAEAA